MVSPGFQVSPAASKRAEAGALKVVKTEHQWMFLIAVVSNCLGNFWQVATTGTSR